MKVCVIGDVHGTTKFLECYGKILKNDNDCDKIIVHGDHFDPYLDISIDTIIERYNKFIQISKEDTRIISLLGNHDLSYYIISGDKTSRTSVWNSRKIRECILPNLSTSYLCYFINDYIFSHAGVSQDWMNTLSIGNEHRILNNYIGWTESELERLTSFYPYDNSYYGDHPFQGPTWIRPTALINNPFGDFNQVVAHTRVKEINKVKMSNDKDLWMIDTC